MYRFFYRLSLCFCRFNWIIKFTLWIECVRMSINNRPIFFFVLVLNENNKRPKLVRLFDRNKIFVYRIYLKDQPTEFMWCDIHAHSIHMRSLLCFAVCFRFVIINTKSLIIIIIYLFHSISFDWLCFVVQMLCVFLLLVCSWIDAELRFFWRVSIDFVFFSFFLITLYLSWQMTIGNFCAQKKIK